MKKYNILFIIIILFITIINFILYSNYYNDKILNITNHLVEVYNIKPSEAAKIIKENNKSNNILSNYGYSKSDLFLNSNIKIILIINILLNIILFYIVFIIIYKISKNKKKKELNNLIDITSLLEEINKGNYKIDLNNYTENDYSLLRDQIYKTVGLLKNQTINLNKEKLILKDNLADISHQIRTPLTSINLMLENIIEDKDMDIVTKEKFINKIYNQIEKINYLVDVLLKLSKFDGCIIKFKKENILLNDLLNDIINNLEVLLKEKNIKIKLNINENIKINADKKWQEEALTNIIKNAINFSHKDSTINIEVNDNKFYTEITIKDSGTGIDENEIKKIFNRFYKTDSSEGFGIGLNLAKTIIEKDQGLIDVQSIKSKYTKFIIKYMK